MQSNEWHYDVFIYFYHYALFFSALLPHLLLHALFPPDCNEIAVRLGVGVLTYAL